ncbi:MAG: hypothetical protein HQL27_03790 [Candidatus Omnitrophica bacterium]|nr:hypothetical protein [Candidatus Omnitrophota bacterium]
MNRKYFLFFIVWELFLFSGIDTALAVDPPHCGDELMKSGEIGVDYVGKKITKR